MYLCIYIYIARWLIVGLPFIYQYICIYHYTLYPQYTIIYTSVYHIGLPLAYTLHPKKNPHNILHCIPNIPIYIFIYVSISHWLTIGVYIVSQKNHHNILHCIPNILLYIYVSISHWLTIGLYIVSQKKNNILHCIPNMPLYTYIYTHQYFTLAYHWLIHCIPKKTVIYYIVSLIYRYIYIHISISHWLTIGLNIVSQKILIIYYIVSLIYRYIYTSVYHIGLPLAYTLYLQYTIMCVYIYIHISISPRYIQSLSFFSGYQDAALIFQPSQLVLRGADDGCPGWCGMKSSGKC